jgi:hypothetical protein
VPIGFMLLIACGPRVLVVESDTAWSGAIGNSSRDGFSNQTFEIQGAGIFCWAIQKRTRGGYLRAYVRSEGLTGTGREGFGETNAEFGVVTGCSQ